MPMPVFWPWPAACDVEPEPTHPGVNQGKRRGVTKSPKPKPRKRR